MRWIHDDEYDIGITFWNVVTLIKYKDSVIVRWFKRYPSAPKYVKCSIGRL